MRNGIVGAWYYCMTLTNEARFGNIGRHDEPDQSLLLRMKRQNPSYQPRQQESSATRSSEVELRRAAGGPCHDTFLQTVHGWTRTEIDAIATVTQKSPVHMAAWKGNISNLVYLVDTLGCSIDRISEMTYSYGKTCLFFALTQSRCDVAEYLLERGAHVKIVNNKGQSPLSIASSHFFTEKDQHIVQKIIQAEQDQEHLEWTNYRQTHSDHCIYGDLDPRFLPFERPINVDTDMITPYAINPTTKAIRRSGLYRKLNNFSFGRQQDDPSMPSSTSNQSQEIALPTTKKRSTPKQQLSPEDVLRLDAAWNEMRASCLTRDETSPEVLRIQVCRIIRIYSKLQRAWIPEVVDKLRRIDGMDEMMMHMVINNNNNNDQGAESSSSAPVMLSKQDHVLMRRVYNYYIDPLCYRQQSEIFRSDSSPSSAQERDCRLDDLTWHKAYNFVHDLSLQRLMAQSTVMTTTTSHTDPTHPVPTQESQQYLSLPYTPIWVDTIEQLSNVRDAMQRVPLVAIDAEWHDTDTDMDSNNNSDDSMLSTLQIAVIENLNSDPDAHSSSDTKVWVLDLLMPFNSAIHAEYRNLCQLLIRDIFGTKIVLGFALSHDIKRLEHFCARQHDKLQPPQLLLSSQRILDVQSLWKQPQTPGLARCVQDVAPTTSSNTPTVLLSKEYQCSNWSQRPLSPSQLHYAGLDAVIILYLFSEQYRRLHLKQPFQTI